MKKRIMSITIAFILVIIAILNIEYAQSNINLNNLKMIAIITGFMYIFSIIFFKRGWREGCDLIFTWRYPIALIIFIFCIFLEINGSSIGMWSQYIPGGDINNKDILFGKARPIRSDEWAVNTPMMLSQYYNYFGKFPYFSETIRGGVTDAFIVYGQPVLDIGEIFRPFYWGYLFLSPAKGLAFFWCGRFIGLLLISFEFGRLITKDNKKLAIVLSSLVSLAPIVQWWFAINGLIEMLFFGSLAIIMLNKYMSTNSYIKRLICIFVCAICAGGYILTFYPSWQVPLAYVFVVVATWVIFEKYKSFKFSYKDIILIIISVSFLGLVLGHVFMKSFDTIKTVTQTVYPGARSETGGDAVSRLFNYPTNIFFPFKESNIPGNVCEQAVFFDFFPIGLILALIVIFKEKKKDFLLIALLTINTFLGLWCTFKWPVFLAKITLLSNSQPGRAYLAVGLVNVLMLIRALAISENKLNIKKTVIASMLMAIFVTIFTLGSFDNYLNKYMVLVILILLSVSFFAIFSSYGHKNNKLIFLCAAIVVISGVLVNPIQRGVDVIYKKPLAKTIKSINESNRGLWIVEGSGFPISNFPIMVGAPTINSTNVYPMLERWEILDPKGENKEVYNRYAHINLQLNNSGKSTFVKGESPDQFTVMLDINDLKTLDVKYILTKNDIEGLNNEKIDFEKLYDELGYKIYKVNIK